MRPTWAARSEAHEESMGKLDALWRVVGRDVAFLLTGCALVFLLGILLMERASAGGILQSVWSLVPQGCG